MLRRRPGRRGRVVGPSWHSAGGLNCSRGGVPGSSGNSDNSVRTDVLARMRGVNLTEWVRAQGVYPKTAYRWFREGTLPVPAVRVNPRSVLVTAMVVEHRDRLGRMNSELVEPALATAGRRLVVGDDGEVDDLVQVLTSFCARLYGRRSAWDRALKAVRCAQRDIGPAALSVPGARMANTERHNCHCQM
jgi:hypothetical protein